MKKIRLRTGELTSLNVLRLVAGSSPNRALSVDEMRRRVRILDALDALLPDAETMMLEDEDTKTLAAAIEGFPWSSASRALLTIIDDVLQAEPALRLVEKD